mgnify:FL=1
MREYKNTSSSVIRIHAEGRLFVIPSNQKVFLPDTIRLPATLVAQPLPKRRKTKAPLKVEEK